MSDALLAAIIAGSVAITVALITQFAAEAYKRHRDGSAVAAALAGELAAYGPAIKTLRRQFSAWVHVVGTGDRQSLRIYTFDRPTDVVFPAMTQRLGLLGVDIVERAVFVYGQIHAFRVAYELIAREHSTMRDEELIARLNSCIGTLDLVLQDGELLVGALRARAKASFLGR